MKKLINTVLLLFLIGIVSSCLKSGLDDLEAYNEAEITNLNFEYRCGMRLRIRWLLKHSTLKNNFARRQSDYL